MAEPTKTSTISIQTTGDRTYAVLDTGRVLAVEWGPSVDGRWYVRGAGKDTEKVADADNARRVLLETAIAVYESLPPCGMNHAEHMDTWRSWRDDCVDPIAGCGFAMQDVDQCRRGHPDDGVTNCGACGHDVAGPSTCPDHHVRMVAHANGCWHCPAEGCLSAFHTSDCLPT